ILSDGGQDKFILGASWATKSKPTKPQDALKMREPHLNLLALTSRLLKPFGASERPGNVAGMLMDIARDLARWFFWTALRFERTYIAVELAGAIQKRLALMHGATRPKPLPAWAVVKVACRVISKVAPREGERGLLASAAISLASTANPSPPTRPPPRHVSTIRSNTRRITSPSRKRSLRARENAEWSGMASSMPSLQNQR